MSTLDEKMQSHEPSTGTLARQRFKTLKIRWGVENDLDWAHPPEIIRVLAMGYRETWKQWKPGGEPKKPDDTEYQLVEKERSDVTT